MCHDFNIVISTQATQIATKLGFRQANTKMS